MYLLHESLNWILKIPRDFYWKNIMAAAPAWPKQLAHQKGQLIDSKQENTKEKHFIKSWQKRGPAFYQKKRGQNCMDFGSAFEWQPNFRLKPLSVWVV